MADASDGTKPLGEPVRGSSVRAGMKVYDASGARLGSVERTEPGKGYFETKSGWLFGHTLYIPRDAVARIDDSGIHLKVAKIDLDRLDWYLPPTDGVDLDTPYSPSPRIETGYGQGRRSVPPGERARMLERDEQAGIRPPSPPPADVSSGAGRHETTDTLPSALAPDTSSASGDDVRGETTIAVPVAEEHLEAVTHGAAAGAGTARVHKVVSSERQSLEVPVAHDELRVERVPLTYETAARTPGPSVFTDKDIDVPLMGEEVILQKRTRVTEEVVLRKRQMTEQRTYSGEVRKERVWVEGTDGRTIDPGSGTSHTPGAGERDISDEDTIIGNRHTPGHEGPEAFRS